MTGLESITKKILEDAENKANDIIENAKSGQGNGEGASGICAQKKSSRSRRPGKTG